MIKAGFEWIESGKNELVIGPGVEGVYLVKVPEECLCPDPCLCQVGNGQLVPVVEEYFFQVLDVPALSGEKLGHDVLSSNLGRLAWRLRAGHGAVQAFTVDSGCGRCGRSAT